MNHRIKDIYALFAALALLLAVVMSPEARALAGGEPTPALASVAAEDDPCA